MTIFSSRLSRSLVTGILVLGGFLSASPSHVLAAGDDTHVCKGTPAAPGVLKADSYESVVVEGFCAVSQGVAVVKGDVTVRPGGVLGAIFALNDYSNRGHSRLIVRGDLSIEKGATAFLGCDPQEFPCLDDPNLNSPTLQTSFEVDGNITAHSALGVVIHHGTIGGNLVVTGGGGGTSCTPTGVFAANGSPDFTAVEFSHIKGDVRISDFDSCWLGVENNTIIGDVRLVDNQLADPDAVEIQSNSVKGDLTCLKNSAVWDSGDTPSGTLFPRIPAPNTVHGDRVGQCVLSSPTASGGPSGPGAF